MAPIHKSMMMICFNKKEDLLTLCLKINILKLAPKKPPIRAKTCSSVSEILRLEDVAKCLSIQ